MSNVSETIQKMGVVPVVVLNDAKDAAPLAKHCVRADFHVQKLHSVLTQQRNLSVS